MKKNKICIGLVTVMLAGSIMTGCQNGGSESTDAKGTAKDTAKTTEKTTDPSA